MSIVSLSPAPLPHAGRRVSPAFSRFSVFLGALGVKSLKVSAPTTAPAHVNNVVTIRPRTALLDDPITGGNSVFLIAALLAAAVTYEAFQSLNRFAALTRDDVPKAEKRAQSASPNLTAPLLL
jgi:hypothetical protein